MLPEIRATPSRRSPLPTGRRFKAVVLFGAHGDGQSSSLLEIIQLRGFIFSAQPLKPDFSRINPAKGMKRLFLDADLLKEALKSVLKMTVYTVVAFLLVRSRDPWRRQCRNGCWKPSPSAMRSAGYAHALGVRRACVRRSPRSTRS